MRESGEAAVFNSDLPKPAAAVVDPAKAVKDLIAAGESATLEAPGGKTPKVRTVWIVDQGNDTPRFVTAYLLEEGDGSC